MFRCLIVIAFLTSQQVSAEGECDRHLTRAQQVASYQNEFANALQAQPAFARAYLKIVGRLQRSRILQQCAQDGGCTNTRIAYAVQQAVAGSSAHSKFIGFGIWAGGMIANAAVLAGISKWVNPQLEYFPLFVNWALGELVVFSVTLMSPFSDPLFMQMRRWSYEIFKGAPTAPQSARYHSPLEDKADVTNGVYSAREQYMGDRIFQFRNGLRLGFQTAAAAYQSGNELAVQAEICAAAIDGYLYFKDVDFAEAAIRNAIWASFLIHVPNPQALKPGIMTLIRDRIHVDDEAEKYFQRTLDAWLGAEPNPADLPNIEEL